MRYLRPPTPVPVAEDVEVGDTKPNTFSEVAQRIKAEKDAKVTAEQEMVERFGITKGEALKTLAHYKKAASDAPMNVNVDLPLRAYYAAHEALETLGFDVWGDGDVLSGAMLRAESPRDFWKRLEDSSQEEGIEE